MVDVSTSSCGPLSLGRYLAHIQKYTRSFMNRRLEGAGLDGSTFGTMMYLFHKDGITEREISDHMLVDKATTTRTISKLEGLGFVVRTCDPNDRRAYRIELTEKAYGIKSEVLEARSEWSSIVLKGISTKEREKLLDMLGRMERNLADIKDKGD